VTTIGTVGTVLQFQQSMEQGKPSPGSIVVLEGFITDFLGKERLRMKISGIEFSMAGDKYLGRKYEEMDCQGFVERCMADVGYPRDLGGSNSWYRECMKNGWVGSPEDCAKEFGSVPKGALLFILEAVGDKTPAKFRNDGIGDATHMGIVTGRGDGAIHSSKSRGGVVTSKFKGKTIPNGGWNRVGLLPEVFEYEGIGTDGTSGTVLLVPHSCNEKNRPLVPPSLGSGADVEDYLGDEETMRGIVTAETGRTVNLRKTKGGKLIERISIGTEVEILDYGSEWCKVKAGRYKGWMMTKFITIEGVKEDELGDHCCCCDHCGVCLSGGLLQ
jgi:hypothetical protein